MGRSFTFRAPVAPFVGEALANSMKLAALAFVLVVPLGHRRRRVGGDAGRALGAIACWCCSDSRSASCRNSSPRSCSSSCSASGCAGCRCRRIGPKAPEPLTQIRYLILPALPLVLVFFGYVARVARVGTIEALDADYTRTAVLKGLSMGAVMRRHVLRNALLPTITVTASLLGYLAGGLVVIETMFHYRGIGALIYTAARAKDFPMLEAGVLTVGAVYALASVAADLLSAALNPRLRTAA
jgi:peptide/nickel transport system permease protein